MKEVLTSFNHFSNSRLRAYRSFILLMAASRVTSSDVDLFQSANPPVRPDHPRCASTIPLYSGCANTLSTELWRVTLGNSDSPKNFGSWRSANLSPKPSSSSSAEATSDFFVRCPTASKFLSRPTLFDNGGK